MVVRWERGGGERGRGLTGARRRRAAVTGRRGRVLQVLGGGAGRAFGGSGTAAPSCGGVGGLGAGGLGFGVQGSSRKRDGGVQLFAP